MAVGKEVGYSGAKDENLIPVLRRLSRPTFFSLDRNFYRRDWAHAGYCLVWLDVRAGQAAEYMRRFLRPRSFDTQAKRLGNVARVHVNGIDSGNPARAADKLRAGLANESPLFSKTVHHAMNIPDLQALQRGDAAAWDEAFPWLWPAAFGAAQITLQAFLPADVEDVAIEALEELIEQVREVKAVEELKPLVASIAHHRAVSRLREHFAAKRGSGQTASLEARAEEEREDAAAAADSPLASLERKELAEVLRMLLVELNPPQGELLADFFLHGLSYEEMAKKHGLAMGSVGVYLKRGLESVRRTWERREEELKDRTGLLR